MLFKMTVMQKEHIYIQQQQQLCGYNAQLSLDY